MAKQTLKEALKEQLVSAADQIRHQVVEEPWFGKATTEDLAADRVKEVSRDDLYGKGADHSGETWFGKSQEELEADRGKEAGNDHVQAHEHELERDQELSR